MARTALYRHFDADNQLLYVGITRVIEKRTREHLSGSSWCDRIQRVEALVYPTRAEAEIAEWMAIENESPIFNVHRPGPVRPTGRFAEPVTALGIYLAKNGIRQKHFAPKVGITQGALSKICNGGATSVETAVAIERETGGAVRATDLKPFNAINGAA